MCWTTTGTPTYQHFFLLLFFFRKSSDKLKIYINKSVFMKKREKIMIFYVLEAMTCLMH